MEEDIQNYSPTVMFRGTPCIYIYVYIQNPDLCRLLWIFQDRVVLMVNRLHTK